MLVAKSPCWICSFIILGMLAATSIGCKEKAEEIGLVTGKVLLDGEAVTNATVFFRSRSRGIHIMAPVDELGVYKVYTAGGQGLPLGGYMVCVVPDGPQVEVDMETGQLLAPSGTKQPKTKVPMKYQDVKTSGLSVTVTSGENECDIEMVSDS